MLKSRTAQLIFQTVYCTLGIVGFIASLGIFDKSSITRKQLQHYWKHTVQRAPL